MNYLYISSGIITACLSIIYYNPFLYYIALFLLYSIVLLCVGAFLTLYFHCIFTAKKNRVPVVSESTNIVENAIKSSLFARKSSVNSKLPVIFGRSVDGLLQQIIDFSIRDFIDSWLKFVIEDPTEVKNIIRSDIWYAIQKLKERSTKIDASRMIAVDMVSRITVHFEKIRVANAIALETGEPATISTTSYLEADGGQEKEFMRKCSEIFLVFLFPKGYSIKPLLEFLSTLLSERAFLPLIEMITSPDYLNQKIVYLMEKRLALVAISKRSYEYATSYDDFLKLIDTVDSVDELLKMQNIITNDLIKATTFHNILISKGSEADNDENNLSRYIQQLSHAKSQCEKKLDKMGWSGSVADNLVSISDVLNTVIGRRHFTIFLQSLNAGNLVAFHVAIEELKNAPKSSIHQLGTEIYYAFLRPAISEIKIGKGMKPRLESFLLGNTGPDVFFEIHRDVMQMLEDNYYPQFLQSEEFEKMRIKLITSDSTKSDIGKISSLSGDSNEENIESSNPKYEFYMDHSSYARNKIDQLQEKICNKHQALMALQESVKPDSDILSILEKELDWLRGEKRQLESHLARTETWGEHLGKWKASVQNVEVTEDKDSLNFLILIHINEDVITPVNRIQNEKGESDDVSSGWIVMRSLAQFQELQRKLRPLCPGLKSMDLPSVTFKLFFSKNDKSILEKAKVQIQKYLNFILENDQLNASESLFSFLSPSSDHLKTISTLPKKTKFSFSTLFKSNENSDPNWAPPSMREPEGDSSLYFDGTDNDTHKSVGDGDNKDSIAEPLYALLGEIFDMAGVFKWVRKSLISFVQITYGRTINKQIRDTILNCFDESMLHFYASNCLKSYWPGDEFSTEYPIRTPDIIDETKILANTLLIENIPETLGNLVGTQTARAGVQKIFDNIQNHLYNKQLFYELFEILLVEIFPELNFLKPEQSVKPPGQERTKDGKSRVKKLRRSISIMIKAKKMNKIHVNLPRAKR